MQAAISLSHIELEYYSRRMENTEYIINETWSMAIILYFRFTSYPHVESKSIARDQ